MPTSIGSRKAASSSHAPASARMASPSANRNTSSQPRPQSPLAAVFSGSSSFSSPPVSTSHQTQQQQSVSNGISPAEPPRLHSEASSGPYPPNDSSTAQSLQREDDGGGSASADRGGVVGENSVGVVVRVRPLATVEHADPSIRSCIQCLRDCVVVGGGSSTGGGGSGPQSALPGSSKAAFRAQQFHVNQVFHPHSSQIEVYEQSCRHIVEGVFRGINGSILAYGATGAGKTHTMFGGAMSAAGIVYQAVQDIFDEKMRLEEEEGRQVRVKCSFVEIYNEEVFDLLIAPPNSTSSTHPRGGASPLKRSLSMSSTQLLARRVPLQVREAAKEDCMRATNPERLTIVGLTHVYPNSAEEFARCIEVGHAHRFVAATGANAQSSRSHAIITVDIQVMDSGEGMGLRRGTVGRIHFCDLAGSERAATTSNTGVRLREGGNINRSLLALGAVVQSLVQRKNRPGKGIYIPYRGSKLTRLLRDGIGGNCQTQMLFCLSPSTKQYEESVNTMQFAMQAKEIQVAAKRNEYLVSSKQVARNQEAVIEELRAEIALLRDELLRSGGRSSQHLTAAPSSHHLPGDLSSRKSSGFTGVHVPGLMNSNFRARSGSSASGPEGRLAFEFPENGTLLVVSAGGADAPSPRALDTSPTGSPTCNTVAMNCTDCAPPQSTLLEGDNVVWTSHGGDHMGRAATRPPSCSRASRSVFTEGSAMFTELESKLKAFSTDKEALYHQMRLAQEQYSDRDIQLREHKWRLARFLASKAMNKRARSASLPSDAAGNGDHALTPVGVAGLRQLITEQESQIVTHDNEIAELTVKMDELDRGIATTRQELLREKQQPSLELLLDNAKLRQSCTEAECLAAHYHQRCRATMNREQEYEEALAACVTAIRGSLPWLPFSSVQYEQARLALVFANLPKADTTDLLTVFESSLKAGATPPLAPPHPPPAAAYSGNTNNLTPISTSCDELEQHYRELVEAASSFRALSPLAGRGRRSHGPREDVEEHPAPPQQQQQENPLLDQLPITAAPLLSTEEDGTAPVEKTVTPPEIEPSNTPSPSSVTADATQEVSAGDSDAATASIPPHPKLPSTRMHDTFIRTYSSPSLVAKHGTQDDKKARGQRKTASAKRASSTPPSIALTTPVSEVLDESTDVLSRLSKSASYSPAPSGPLVVSQPAEPKDIMRRSTSPRTREVMTEMESLLFAQPVKASPARRRFVVLDAPNGNFQRTKTDTNLPNPNHGAKAGGRGRHHGALFVRSNTASELRAVTHPASTRNSILLSHSGSAIGASSIILTMSNKPGAKFTRSASDPTTRASFRQEAVSSRTDTSTGSTNPKLPRNLRQQHSPEDGAGGEPSMDDSTLASSASPRTSAGTSPGSTARTSYGKISANRQAPTVSPTTTHVSSKKANSTTVTQRKSVLTFLAHNGRPAAVENSLTIDSNKPGGRGPRETGGNAGLSRKSEVVGTADCIRASSSSNPRMLSPVDTLFDLMASKEGKLSFCTLESLSVSGEDEMLVSLTTCSDPPTPRSISLE